MIPKPTRVDTLSPPIPTPFFGHKDPLTQLRLWKDSDAPVLVVTGAPGVGKSHLVRHFIDDAQIAAVFCDGDIVGSEGLVDFLLDTLRADLIRENALKSLVAALSSRGIELLVIDRAERSQLESILGELLRELPALKIVLISRVRLSIRGERILEVRAFSEEDQAAIDIYRHHAESVGLEWKTDYDVVVRKIVSLVGGWPLALELVAKQSRFLSPLEQLESLERSLVRPSYVAPLRECIEESLSLLGQHAANVLEMTSVFVGSFDLTAYRAIIGESVADCDEILSALIDASLIVRELRFERSVFRLLPFVHEMMRDRFSKRDDAEEYEKRYRDYYIGLTSPSPSSDSDSIVFNLCSIMDREAHAEGDLPLAHAALYAIANIIRVYAYTSSRFFIRRTAKKLLALDIEGVRPLHLAYTLRVYAMGRSYFSESGYDPSNATDSIRDAIAILQDIDAPKSVYANMLDAYALVLVEDAKIDEARAAFAEIETLRPLPEQVDFASRHNLLLFELAYNPASDRMRVLDAIKELVEEAKQSDHGVYEIRCGLLLVLALLLTGESDECENYLAYLRPRIAEERNTDRFSGLSCWTQGMSHALNGDFSRAQDAIREAHVRCAEVLTFEVAKMSMWGHAVGTAGIEPQSNHARRHILSAVEDGLLSMRLLTNLREPEQWGNWSGFKRFLEAASRETFVEGDYGWSRIDVLLARRSGTRLLQSINLTNEPTKETLIYDVGQCQASLGDNEWSLKRRKKICALLEALMWNRLTNPGHFASTFQIFSSIWGSEEVAYEAAQHRVYVVVSTLRKLGLDEIVERSADGYRLNPNVEVTLRF